MDSLLAKTNRRHFTALAALLTLAPAIATASAAQDAALKTNLTLEMLGTTESWLKDGEQAIADRLARQPNTNQAKNVILFVGDGMGISTLTAARILEGQLGGNSGEENYLSFEKFPYTALVKTYNVDAQVPDSAGTATALNTGVKTRVGAINTGPLQQQRSCKNIEANTLRPITYYAEQAGMSTGVVSTARLTHATPATVYAVSPARNWESDSDMPDVGTEGCRDIAQQIIGDLGGNGLEVALGGGRTNFLPEGEERGRRSDGRNLTNEWRATDDNAVYVSNRSEMLSIDVANTSRLLGLFDDSHMDYELDREERPSTPDVQPSIAEMTETAIKMLSKNENGFYLLVEGGRVDHAHHMGNAQRALKDAIALSDAVRKAMEMVDLSETLILVTADHSHVFTMAGYPRRGNPIFGLVRPIALISDDPELAKDDKPYTTLGYQNGPGAISGERPDLTDEQVANIDFRQQALVPTRSETHGGEDVGLFAIGPWAHLATGTMEQNVVFHIMDHALQLRKRASAK